jgi:CDP-glucose 4,6-dehydratase
VNGCLENRADIERAIVAHSADTVIHLGAQAIVDVARMAPLSTFETNVRGTWNVLETCREQHKLVQRVIVASSDKAYGEHTDLPYTEDMALRGKHPYEVSKSCADLIAQSYYETYDLPIAVARCGNIYGGGDLNWSRIVPSTVRSIHQGKRPILRSDGRYIRDYIYVKDVVLAYLTLANNLHLDHVRGQSFNFSSESRVTVLEIVDEIRRLMGREDLEPLVLNTASGEILNQYLSSSKALRLLGWKSAYTLAEGLAETISWYRSFLAASSEEPSLIPEAAH